MGGSAVGVGATASGRRRCLQVGGVLCGEGANHRLVGDRLLGVEKGENRGGESKVGRAAVGLQYNGDWYIPFCQYFRFLVKFN